MVGIEPRTTGLTVPAFIPDAASGSAPAVILDLSDEKDKDNVTTTLLENALPSSQRRYATSELTQFFIVLKRTLLFSRRDWVSYTVPYLNQHLRSRTFVKQHSSVLTELRLTSEALRRN